MRISRAKRNYLKNKYGKNRSANEDYLKEYSIIWNNENKDKFRKYYTDNKEKILKRVKAVREYSDRTEIECCCGLKYLKYNENRHFISINHCKRMVKLVDNY